MKNLNKSHFIVAAIAFVLGLTGALVFMSRPTAILLPGEDPGKTIYAILGSGEKILAEQVAPQIKSDLFQLEKNKYYLKKKAVEDLIYQEEIAKKSADQALANQDVEISQDEFSKFLKDHSLIPNKMTARQKADALANFKISKKMIAKKSEKKDQIEALQIQWKIPMTFLAPPVVVEKGNFPSMTKARDGIPVVIFANYNCPFCQEAYKKIKFLQTKYDDKVSVYYRFALNESESSVVFQSALTTVCANEQNKMPSLFEALYQQTPDSLESLNKTAEVAGLDMKSLETCVKSSEAKTKLKNDIKAFEKLNLEWPAAIFIKGHAFPIQESQDFIQEFISLSL
jgi:predicted DsbA family dithiol-disulfide isomerase